jgi:hypothetical protein
VVDELGLNLFTSEISLRIPARNEKLVEVGAKGEGVEDTGNEIGDSAKELGVPLKLSRRPLLLIFLILLLPINVSSTVVLYSLLFFFPPDF